MKKLIVILMSAILIMTGLILPASASEEDLSGTWYLYSALQDGIEMDASMISSMGMSITMTLNEDGTAVLEMNGETQEGTWNSEGGLTINETAVPYEIVDGHLQFAQNGSTMVFSREQPTAESFTIPPVIESPQISDFNGTWNASIYDMMGMQLPMKLTGTGISITILDGVASYTETIYDMNDNFSVTETIEREFPASLEENGTLFISFGEEAVLAQVSPGSSGFVFTLHEDGVVTATIPELDEQMQMLADLSATVENIAAETPEGETVEEEGASEGGSSGEFSMSAYFIFEKAE